MDGLIQNKEDEMLREKESLLKANKRTVASMDLVSFEATGLLVFKGNEFTKVYKISRKEKIRLCKEELEEFNFKFFYISAEGNTYLNYLSVSICIDSYDEAKEKFEDFESRYELIPMEFDYIMNQILGIRDKEYDFSLTEFIHKKYDLVEFLEKEEKGVENSFVYQEIELNVYPNDCQSKILNLLRKMELPYILMIEKEMISEEEFKGISRNLEKMYYKAPIYEEGYAYGKIRLLIFSLDEETLNIASNTVVERFMEEGFIAAKKPIGEKASYRYMTSFGLIGSSTNTVVNVSTLQAFI